MMEADRLIYRSGRTKQLKFAEPQLSVFNHSLFQLDLILLN
jgi:hypothetical protein